MLNSLSFSLSAFFILVPPLQLRRELVRCVSLRAIKISFMAKWSSRFLLLNVLRERVSSVYSSNPFERASWKIEKHLFDRFNCVRKVFEKTRLTRLETVRWIVAQPVKLFSNRWTARVPNHRAWNICWFCSFWWTFYFFIFFKILTRGLRLHRVTSRRQ